MVWTLGIKISKHSTTLEELADAKAGRPETQQPCYSSEDTEGQRLLPVVHRVRNAQTGGRQEPHEALLCPQHCMDPLTLDSFVGKERGGSLKTDGQEVLKDIKLSIGNDGVVSLAKIRISAVTGLGAESETKAVTKNK